MAKKCAPSDLGKLKRTLRALYREHRAYDKAGFHAAKGAVLSNIEQVEKSLRSKLSACNPGATPSQIERLIDPARPRGWKSTD